MTLKRLNCLQVLGKERPLGDVLVAFDGCKVGLAAVSDVEVWVFYLKKQKHRFRTRIAAFGSKN